MLRLSVVVPLTNILPYFAAVLAPQKKIFWRGNQKRNLKTLIGAHEVFFTNDVAEVEAEAKAEPTLFEPEAEPTLSEINQVTISKKTFLS